MAEMPKSLEQRAREILTDCGVEDAMSKTAGDVVSLANILSLLAESRREHHWDNSHGPWMCPTAADKDAKCDCGATEWNAKIDTALNESC